MGDTGDLIQKQAGSFAKDMSAAVAKARAAAVKKAGGDGDGRFVSITFQVSRNPASRLRTPEQQAAQVAAGRSWTCSGAHLLDAARHVMMMVAQPGQRSRLTHKLREAFGKDAPFFMTEAEFQAEWQSAMSRNHLVNAAGRVGWYASDGFHLELPEHRLDDVKNPRVQACLREYVRLSRGPKGKPNTKFENSPKWGKALRPLLGSGGSGTS